MPREPSSAPNASGPRKSRRTGSCRSVFQSKPIAPGMCASAYNAGFSSTSTTRTTGLSRCSSSQLVSTSTSLAYDTLHLRVGLTAASADTPEETLRKPCGGR